MEFVQCTDMVCASHSLGYWTYPYAVITFIFFKSFSRMISLILLRFGCCILVLFISLFRNVLKLSFHEFSVFFWWIYVIEMNQNWMHTVFYDRNNKNGSRQLEVVIIIYSYKNTLTLRRFGSQSQFICALVRPQRINIDTQIMIINVFRIDLNQLAKFETIMVIKKQSILVSTMPS